MSLLQKTLLDNGDDLNTTEGTPGQGFFSGILDSIPSPVAYINTEHRYQYVNRAYVNWYGVEEKDVLNKTPGEFLGSEVAAVFLPYMERALNGEQVSYQTEVNLPMGKRYIDVTYTPDFGKSNEVLGYVTQIRDITEAKALEQRLASQRQIDRIAELDQAKLAAIVQSSDDAIISKTLGSIVTSWNDAAERLFGYTAEEMIGQPITRLIPSDRLDEETVIIGKLKNGEKIDHFETIRKAKDGRLINISLTISPVKDSSGTIIGASKIARDITHQKKLLEDLRENEERLRMAIESTNLGTWEFHPLTKDLSCSKECRDIIGVPDDVEINNQFAYDYTHPDDHELVRREIKRAIDPSGPGSCEIQYRIIRYDNNDVRWVKVKGKTFFKDGHAERFIGTILDVTEDKQQEEELKQSVEMFQTMADNVPAMIWMSGNDRFEDYFNNTWLKFRGRTLEEESNEGWLDGIHPDDIQSCINTYNDSFRQQQGFYTEYRLRRYDGEYRWISDSSVPRFGPDGEFLGFISACIDIDDQKRFREKILDSELLFKTISNASPAGLWMTDVDGQNVFVNETWIIWTGIPFEQQLLAGWTVAVVPEDREKVAQKFVEASRDRKYYHAEFRFEKANGEIRWGLVDGHPYNDINRNFAGYAGSITDITEIKKIEQRKDDFIKMASHELKTPITSISGYVQLLMNICDETEMNLQLPRATVKSSLSTIAKQVAKLTRLISELLDLSKIESGKLELNKSKFELAALVEETVQDIHHTSARHEIKLQNDFKGKIYGDKDRIGQVLSNLLTNAIKYSPGTDTVEVVTASDEEYATITVKDGGIGIDPKDHQRIFERFYRVEGKSEQTYPGFGIGLFIASEIVQRHHGTILVKSEKGKGSEFTVKLPLMKE